ncbi:transcription elongation factor GreA [Candidatus Falkowbacteria bacterium CG_4_10_14_0_2_um_filter_48_10]|uniref:Transcription elongation factor GreA n=1 Tax=Candidatus Falkowbacteria bacterium CG23_combo_of_CG06-09_8_20_14_all_49_15 TaxID=1974572 RepID=A0A2G9ZKF8_9BACT|nr:MAG: transcription elongation factor GreA [Candidatus Falkowbacteria bacterium CG23_combo_of_CG06-09_8_20_14_all_49_15]PJA07962.1 MAG: transcription elongation factor GreA [Candidatus Falkowbacteria bacterium CG_4_10_14_0_2_um_filter_48_10]
MTDQIISPEGYEKLKNELSLLMERRREIADRIEKAKEMGDLSENAEYAEAKDAQSFNEGRIIEIKSLLKNLTIVDNKTNGHFISMGSKIKVSVNGEEKEYLIVSFNEVDPLLGKISNESPLGMSFLGKKVNDQVKVKTPKGEVNYKIISIQ